MIDAIAVPPVLHMTVGTLVLITSLLAVLVTGQAAWKKEALSPVARFLFVLFQVVLMVQVLIGIKLLDQGSGPLQLYIHYVGGLAPMAFVLLYYWFPSPQEVTRTRRATAVSVLSFVFVLMTFAIGGMYVPGG